jgi:hypothetical protein
MPVWQGGPKTVGCDGSAVKNPETRQTLKTLRPVITLRSKHGYSATKYEASPVESPKTLQRQSGRSYGQKKVRNREAAGAISAVTPTSAGWRNSEQQVALTASG